MARKFALTGARVFDGSRLLDAHAVVVEGARIAALVPVADLASAIDRRHIEGLLAPGFIDCQVNGGGGIFFNADTSASAIAGIGRAHRRFGTTGFLATLITGERAQLGEALRAGEAALATGTPGFIGLHLEGPFLSPDRKGVHDPRLMRAIEPEDVAVIAAARAGRILMTIAPEKMPVDTIAKLAGAGIVLSAGHTAATYETIVAAREAGLTGFTHLFNAMPPLSARDPGPVGAALDDADAYASLIVDLIHVSAPSLRIAVAARGWRRTMLVTDAMPTVGTDLAEFVIGGATVVRSGGRLTRASDGTLAGADLDMAEAVRNGIGLLGVGREQALRMASLHPARFLGLADRRGRIAPGCIADLTVLDARLSVLGTWVAGAWLGAAP